MDETFVLIEGMTDVEVRVVHVQEVPYKVVDGIISVLWSLTSGTNEILVEVSDEAGNVRSESFTVFFEYEEYVPPSPTIQEEEDRGLFIWSGIILVIAMTIIATTVLLYQKNKRRW